MPPKTAEVSVTVPLSPLTPELAARLSRVLHEALATAAENDRSELLEAIAATSAVALEGGARPPAPEARVGRPPKAEAPPALSLSKEWQTAREIAERYNTSIPRVMRWIDTLESKSFEKMVKRQGLRGPAATAYRLR